MALEDRAALVVGVSSCGFSTGSQSNTNKSIHGEITQATYDAIKIADLLSRNDDDKSNRNFQVRCLLSKDYQKLAEKKEQLEFFKNNEFFNNNESCFGSADLKEIEKELRKLFFSEVSTAIFYFSGHANWDEQGKYAELIPSDYSNEGKGIKFDWLLELLFTSSVKNKIVILDCCFSGCLGMAPEKLFKDIVILKDGITLLTSSRNNEFSKAKKESLYSLFTEKLISSLSGGSANLLGEVTLFNAYSFIEEICFYNEQRPILRTSSKADCIIREVEPAIDLKVLKKITEYFPKEKDEIALSIVSFPEMKKLLFEKGMDFSDKEEQITLKELMNKFENRELMNEFENKNKKLDKKVFHKRENYRIILLLSLIDKGLIKYTEQTREYTKKLIKEELNEVKNYTPTFEIFKPIYDKIKPLVEKESDESNKNIDLLKYLTFYLEYELTDLGKYYWNRIRQGMI